MIPNIRKTENFTQKQHMFHATMLSLALVYVVNMLCLLFLERAFNESSILYHRDVSASYLSAVQSHISLTPLGTIKGFAKEILRSGADFRELLTGFSKSGIAFYNLFGNVVFFIPIGIFIPYFFPRYENFFRFAPLMLAITFSVESIQLLTLTGRFDIDDIILNLIGGCMGCILFLIIQGIIFLFSKINMKKQSEF